MKITQINIYKLNIKVTHPIKIPIGVLNAANNVAIKITTDTGIVGWGEASPFSPITGDCQETNLEAGKLLARLIVGKDPLAIDARMFEIKRLFIGEPSVRSAFDMALYDILGKTANLPLYQVLGGTLREIRTDLTIGIQDTVEQTLEHVDRILSMGYDAIKLKVGRSGLADVRHVAAVRNKVGPDVLIKVDSNQGWDYQTAYANLRAMEPFNIQYSEQPLAGWDYENLCFLRKNISTPICADESVFDDKDAFKLTSTGAVDYLNIKLGKSGGIYTGLRIEAIARAAGCKCMIGCFAESRLAISAAAHFAVARPNIAFIDLDSPLNLAADPVIGGVTYDKNVGGLIHMPQYPGIGASFDESVLEEFASIEIS